MRDNNKMLSLISTHIQYICPECTVVLATYYQWIIHLNEIHNYEKRIYEDFNFQKVKKATYKCLKCMLYIVVHETNYFALQLHYISHLPHAKIYGCRYCEFTTMKQAEAGTHLKSIHNKELQNPTETRKFDYRNPKRNSEFYMRFQCPVCALIMNDFSSWLTHINNMHQSTAINLNMQQIAKTCNYYCRSCQRLFYTNDYTVLQYHRFTHLQFPRFYRCAFCTTSKNKKMDILHHFMENHKRIFEETRQFIKKPIEWGVTTDFQYDNNDCNEESRISPNKLESIQINNETVNEEEIILENHVHYKCPECGNEFEKREEWRSHIIITHDFDIKKNFREIEPNKYQCLKCKYYILSKQMGNLQRHHFLHMPCRTYLKCIHCATYENDKEDMLHHLKFICDSKPLTINCKKQYSKLPTQLNLHPKPYDYENIVRHLKESHVNILKIAQESTTVDTFEVS